MKKYTQFLLGITVFAVLVFLRQIKGNQDDQVQPILPPKQMATPTATPTQPVPISTQPTISQLQSKPLFKDGTYTGDVTDAFYGNIQVQVTVSNGKMSDITFLQYPNDNQTSIFINQQAMTALKSEALQSQSAHVDIVSGASDSSQAFQQSLSTALQKAKNS